MTLRLCLSTNSSFIKSLTNSSKHFMAVPCPQTQLLENSMSFWIRSFSKELTPLRGRSILTRETENLVLPPVKDKICSAISDRIRYISSSDVGSSVLDETATSLSWLSNRRPQNASLANTVFLESKGGRKSAPGKVTAGAEMSSLCPLESRNFSMDGGRISQIL